MWILKPGDLIDERYRIEREIGFGGMSRVYAACDEELGETVALKLIRDDLVDDPELIERFKREVRIARQIQHPNVIRIFEFGRTSIGDKDLYYLTMEWLQGRDLSAWVEEQRSLKAKMLLDILLQVCNALAQAHSVGVVHRDIKPQNIFIDKESRAKLMDFGISRLGNLSRLTRGGQVLGTAEFISPEQLNFEDGVDHRADIYSLGVLMFRLTTGRLPFEADTPVKIAMQHIETPPPSPCIINPRIPEEWERVILKCLEKEPDRRYASADELGSALSALQEGLPSDVELFEAKPLPIDLLEVMEPAPKRGTPSQARTTQTVARARNPFPGVWTAIAAVAGILFLATVYLLFVPDDSRPGPPQPGLRTVDDAPKAETTESAPAPEAPPETSRVNENVDVNENHPDHLASIRIVASPPSEIYVDGKHVGSTPPAIQTELAEGEHTIRYVIPDYESFEQTVRVRAGRNHVYSHHFPAHGVLRIVCQPYANVRLDGEHLGYTPVNVEKIRAGEHHLILYREGYETIEETVDVVPGEVNLFPYALTPRREGRRSSELRP